MNEMVRAPLAVVVVVAVVAAGSCAGCGESSARSRIDERLEEVVPRELGERFWAGEWDAIDAEIRGRWSDLDAAGRGYLIDLALGRHGPVPRRLAAAVVVERTAAAEAGRQALAVVESNELLGTGGLEAALILAGSSSLEAAFTTGQRLIASSPHPTTRFVGHILCCFASATYIEPNPMAMTADGVPEVPPSTEKHWASLRESRTSWEPRDVLIAALERVRRDRRSGRNTPMDIFVFQLAERVWIGGKPRWDAFLSGSEPAAPHVGEVDHATFVHSWSVLRFV